MLVCGVLKEDDESKETSGEVSYDCNDKEEIK